MKSSVKIALLYTILGCLWIFLSDHFIEIKSAATFTGWKLSSLQTIKGVIYVSITGILLYFLVKRYHHQLEQKILALEEANLKLKIQSQKLERSNAELEQFAYVVSHDLQEPLRMVHSFVQQIQKKYDNSLDDKAKQYIYFALDGAKKMKQIILDLLDYAMVENDLEEQATAIDTTQVVEEVKIILQRAIKDKDAVITYDNNLPTITSVPGPVRQLFQNIIDNAIKYHRHDDVPKIHISWEATDKFHKFYFKDNGLGIDPEYRDKIFIIFERLHNDKKYKGTGVGLAICKKIVQNLGGMISVDSNEPYGSTFVLSLRKQHIPAAINPIA